MKHEAEAGRWRNERATGRSVVVPLVDEPEAGRIYDRSIHRWALTGMLLGALLVGWFGWALAEGAVTIAGLGQWAASGSAVGAFTGAGAGAAVGGLGGALAALRRLPRRRS
ncbi:MAG TPA: hypothetical protein VF188_07975 [Longimicrobiales bacterium]